jgi:uncharacterized protein YcfJ
MRSASLGALVRRRAPAVLALTVACTGCGTGVRHTVDPYPSALNNWRAVMRIKPPSTITVITVVDAEWNVTFGPLVSVEQNQLTIKTSDGNLTIPRSDIRRVFLSHLHTGFRNTLFGLAKGGLGGSAIGAFAGLLVGGSPALGAAVLGTIGALAGGSVGSIFDMFEETRSDIVLLYYSDGAGSAQPVRR